jgi:hypothetical protein
MSKKLSLDITDKKAEDSASVYSAGAEEPIDMSTVSLPYTHTK